MRYHRPDDLPEVVRVMDIASLDLVERKSLFSSGNNTSALRFLVATNCLKKGAR